MEEKVRTLNKQLQDKMRQRVQLTHNANDNNLKVANDVNVKCVPSSVVRTVEIRTPDCTISPDYYSDSGVHTSSTIVRSPRNSPSEN